MQNKKQHALAYLIRVRIFLKSPKETRQKQLHVRCAALGVADVFVLSVLGNTHALRDFPGSDHNSAAYVRPGTKLIWRYLAPVINRRLGLVKLT